MKNETRIVKDKILLVDDEPRILSSLTRGLNEFGYDEVQTARDGDEAIRMIKNTADLAVIVSDFHMPGMNGIELLVQSQKINPDITRIILTGMADLNTVIESVNRGNIFRFLIKPCPIETFTAALDAGIRQHQLITHERVLLSKTLSGSVKILMDILSILNPEIFSRVNRFRDLAFSLAKNLGLEQSWDIELSALLCQIGVVTIPHDVLEKWQRGDSLDDDERAMVEAIPQVGAQLIKNIPRLERISEAVMYQKCDYDNLKDIKGVPVGEDIPLISRILKVIIDYDFQFQKTQNPEEALDIILNSNESYDPKILNELRNRTYNLVDGVYLKPKEQEKDEQILSIDGLEPGMTLVKNVYDLQGRLVMAKDTVITEVLKIRLNNYFLSHTLMGPMIVRRWALVI